MPLIVGWLSRYNIMSAGNASCRLVELMEAIVGSGQMVETGVDSAIYESISIFAQAGDAL